jgi:hypothetical protein
VINVFRILDWSWRGDEAVEDPLCKKVVVGEPNGSVQLTNIDCELQLARAVETNGNRLVGCGGFVGLSFCLAHGVEVTHLAEGCRLWKRDGRVVRLASVSEDQVSPCNLAKLDIRVGFEEGAILPHFPSQYYARLPDSKVKEARTCCAAVNVR